MDRLWAKLFGYRFHPTISCDNIARVADVGTGTAYVCPIYHLYSGSTYSNSLN